MPSYKDLFEVHLKYADYVRAKSYVIHQYAHNVAVSGSGVEVEVRGLLRSVLPERFKVTSGYVVSATDKATEPSVSPQIDVLVVDTLVPHALWLVDETQGIEIVPREAVVGIIEVKRTLNATSLAEAIAQLREIVARVGIRKDDYASYLPGGLVVGAGLQGPYRGNPLLGIISLGSEGPFVTTPSDVLARALADRATDDSQLLPLDLVLCLSGILVATASPGTADYEPLLVRRHPRAQWAEASLRTGTAGRVALAQGLGFLLAYISKTCGRVAELENYFFNTSIRSGVE